MIQVHSLMVTATEGRRNFSYGQEMREVWYRREDGVEGSLQYSGEFGVRAGNKLALIYSPSISSQWLAIVNFSTEQYINFVPNWATRKTYMFHDLIWPFNKLYPQVEESAFGKQSPAIYQSVESVIGQLIAKRQQRAA
jgi:hypothetical protein